MQAQQAQPARPGYSYAPFYNECALYPELPKFRRFAGPWAKKLYDDVEEILEKERELDAAVAAFQQTQGGAILKAIDCPRSLAKGHLDLRKKWTEYEQILRCYTQDLCLSRELFQFPDHAPYFARRLKRVPNLFPNGDFGPTGETGAATAYQDPNARDFVAWFGMPGSDILTNLFVDHRSWIMRHVHWLKEKVLYRLLVMCGCHRPGHQGSRQTGGTYPLATVVQIIDLLTCIFVPLLLTASMYALVGVRPLRVRVALVGVLGLVFSLSAKVISGRMSRGEIFAYTAAYFAVASVFVSQTSSASQ